MSLEHDFQEYDARAGGSAVARFRHIQDSQALAFRLESFKYFKRFVRKQVADHEPVERNEEPLPSSLSPHPRPPPPSPPRNKEAEEGESKNEEE